MCDNCTCLKVSIIFLSSWVALLIFASLLLVYSFEVVEFNNAGLLNDYFSVQLESNTIYYPGRYYVGVGKTFIKYPTTVQTMNFTESESLSCVTSDNIGFKLNMRVFYKLRPEFLQELYNSFINKNYINAYRSNIKEIVLSITRNFSLKDYLNIRPDISQFISLAINERMRSNLFCELIYLELIEFNFEENAEANIIRNYNSLTRIQVDNILKQSKILEGEIKEIISTAEKQSSNKISEANKTASIILSQSMNEARKSKQTSQATALKQFIDVSNLNFTQTELNKFLLYEKLDDMTYYNSKSNMLFGFNDIEIPF